MQFRKDIWQPMVVEAPIRQIAEAGTLDGLAMRWLPSARELSFSADPFGLWKNGELHVFFENFDYRTAHGTIGVHVLDNTLNVMESRIVLKEPWHLSYPFVFEWEGDVWMLPEACGSGASTLYRALAFPWTWEPAASITLDVVPIDATLLFAKGSWWMFYAPAGSNLERLTELYLAQAPTPLGPWQPHQGNPFYTDLQGARPGGTAFEMGGQVVLPLQDCRKSYGSGLKLLTIANLGEPSMSASAGSLLTPPPTAAFSDGFHTLSEAGPVTLVDVKRRSPSWKGLAMRPLRSMDRWLGSSVDPARPAWN
ncbi:hypothetical protein [Novosphingobium sp. AP12]|uniref:glucosamine inositolphosphorylceramide transferase family protein n=1 Tax=Novosphingobium sp. AP12 TaxID=1144305 RepID=UPI0002720FF3|nr:hypothetical protein [Novosphingobium sp. AP12]EJL28315.1 hypothetical protein PMI02_02615 [Novosphingobium sp. AP12]